MTYLFGFKKTKEISQLELVRKKLDLQHKLNILKTNFVFLFLIFLTYVSLFVFIAMYGNKK